MNTQSYIQYPKISDKVGIAFVALTTFIMCYSYLIPVVPILVFFGMWLPLSYYKKTFILKPSGALFLTLAFPFLCFISFIWSDYPMRTIYTGVQFLVMATCILIMSRTVNFKAFLQGLAMGIMIILLVTFFYSLKIYGSSTFSQPLSGLYGLSKNQIGYVAAIGIFITITLLFSDIEKYKKLVFAILPLCVCLFCLPLTHSATSVISLLFTFCTIAAAWVITRFPLQTRGIIVFLAVLYLATIVIFIIALDFNIFEPILNAFGKDTTLTGRTYLWSEGIGHGMLVPITGHGYDAFWVPFNPPAEQYWDEFWITGQTGFNFHNLYVETFVILGFVGLIIMISIMLYLFINSFYLIAKDGLNIHTCIFFGISSLMLIRSISEVELIGPFGLQSLIFYALIPFIAAYKYKKRADKSEIV